MIPRTVEPGSGPAVALVPMKAHSERVKGKNFRLFHGKPLFRWILDTLLSLEEVGLVVINTDARSTLEGLGVHRLPRVLIRDRRPDLCGDFVSMNLILADDIAAVSADFYIMSHATNPLLRPETVARAIETFREKRARGEADSLFTVNRYQSRFYDATGRPLNHDPNNLIRTQDMEPWFEENSNLYIFTAGSFRLTGARIGRCPALFETPRAESIDIDDEAGWEMAERLAVAQDP
jgi:CMP-N-acetylneuraminic acid synthetase